MPHCNDWVPLGILLALLPLLGFWQHRDNKNHESKQGEEKEDRVVINQRVRYYRQNPYFVVDAPLALPTIGGRSRQRPTHLRVGSAGVPIPLQSIRAQPRLLMTLDTPPQPHSWVQFLSNPDRLRFWRLIPPNSTLTSDRAWFNGSNLMLVNINAAGTTITHLARLQLDVPANNAQPLSSNGIRYEDIPVLAPELDFLELGWPVFFDFGVRRTTNGANNESRFTFQLPENLAGDWPLTFLAFRGPGADEAEDPEPRENATFTPGAAPGTMNVVVPFETGDEDDDLFVFEMFRTSGIHSYPVAVAWYSQNYCDENPAWCGLPPTFANKRRQLEYRP